MHPNKFPLWWVFTIILLEGFVTISAEILVIRQLIPVAGTSVVVTSLIIGVFLLFLAYGYRRGGLYSGNYHAILVRNFTIAAWFLGLGLSYVVIDLLFNWLGVITHQHVLWTLVLYLLLIIAPLVYILGQTVPITMNFCREATRISQIGGKVLHLSTIGSFLGSILTSLVLMNYLGVAWTVVINFGLLVILVLLVLKDHHLAWGRLTGLACCAFLTWAFNVNFANQEFIAMDNYGNYAVKKDISWGAEGEGRVFVINNSPSSYLNAKEEGFPYIEVIRQILFQQLKLRDKNILVLGAGGFTLSAKNTFDNHFTYVDIDPNLAKIAKPAFISAINGKFIGEDARLYVQKFHDAYDAIVSDVYSNQHAVPPALLTLQYFLSVKHALKPNGTAIFNIIANPMLNNPYAKRVDNTIRAAFGNCMVIPLAYVNQNVNIIYVCNKAATSSDHTVYTDDKNTATIDYYNF